MRRGLLALFVALIAVGGGILASTAWWAASRGAPTWSGPPPSALPQPVIEVAAPGPFGALDAALQDAPAGVLVDLAWSAYDRGEFEFALTAASHAASRDDAAASSYDLACFAALAGEVDAAAQWLQQAALAEGIDAVFAHEDSDLRSLKASSHWPALSLLLVEAQEYWKHNTPPAVHLAAPWPPSEAAPPSAPAMVWLHGLGAEPEGFVSAVGPEVTDMGVVLIGLSATQAAGPHSFAWSEDLELDRQHVTSGIRDVEERFGTVLDPLVLIGFSQGGHLAAALLASGDPLFDGAIVISPGWRGEADYPAAQADHRRGAVVLVGGGEHPDTIATAKAELASLEGVGVSVLFNVDPEQADHTLPIDFLDQLGVWFTHAAGAPQEP